MSLATSDSIPNAIERKVKEEKNERKKRRKKRRRKKRGVVQSHGWKKVHCRRTTNGWISPAVGGTGGQPYSSYKPTVGLGLAGY
jgi:hypothetical protein